MLLAPDVLCKVGAVRKPRAADVTCHRHHAGRCTRDGPPRGVGLHMLSKAGVSDRCRAPCCCVLDP
eukprot:7656910-Lingulodinium_polyedra.AAC.1